MSRLDDNSVQMREIIEDNVFFHPQYQFGESYFDLALVKLDPPVRFSLSVRTICLPEFPSSDTDEYSGDLVRLSGKKYQQEITGHWQ